MQCAVSEDMVKLKSWVALDAPPWRRGIDVEDNQPCYNYDSPRHRRVNVHRIGRTGVLAKKGPLFSLIEAQHLSIIPKIEPLH